MLGSTVSGLVIHAGAMRRKAAGQRVLETGGGVLNGDAFRQLRNTDRADRARALRRGRAQRAFLMGGGIGLAMREHGVGCDSCPGGRTGAR